MATTAGTPSSPSRRPVVRATSGRRAHRAELLRRERVGDVGDRRERLTERNRPRRDEDRDRASDEDDAEGLPDAIDLDGPDDRADDREDHGEHAGELEDDGPGTQRSVAGHATPPDGI